MSDGTGEGEAPAALLDRGIWVQQGPATLVVRDAGWIVLVPGMRKEVVEAAWTVLGDPPEPDALLARIVETAGLEGEEKIPALLFGLVDGQDATLGVKGKTLLSVHTAEGVEQLPGADGEMVLRTVTGVQRIAFGDLPPEESVGGMRLQAGISRARGFVQMTVSPSELDEEARAALAARVEQEGRSIEDEEAKARRAKAAERRPAPASTSSSGSSGDSTPVRRPTAASRAPGEMPPSLAGGRSASRGASAEPAAPSGPSVFDGLFGSGPPAAGDPAPEPTAGAAPAPADTAAPTPAAPAAEKPVPEPAAEQPTAPASSVAPAPEPAEPAPAAPAPTAAEPEATTPEPPAAAEQPEATAPEPPAAAKQPVTTEDRAPAEQPAPAEDPAPTEGTAGPGQPDTTSDISPAARPEDPAPVPGEAAAPDADGAREDHGSGSGAETARGPVAAPTEAPGPAPRRRLVSTSLFDRPRRTAAPNAPATPAPGPAAPAPAPAADDAPGEDDPQVTLIAPVDPDDLPDESTQVPPPEPADAPPAAPEPTPAATSAPEPREATPTDAGDAPGRRAGIPAELESTGAYDDLFGKTVHRRVEDAAVRRREEDAEDLEHTTGGTPRPSEDPAPAPPEAPAEPEPREPSVLPEPAAADAASDAIGGDFIDWVPGVGRAAPEIARTAARRAEAPRVEAPAYPQVHMPERPEAPHAPHRPASPAGPQGAPAPRHPARPAGGAPAPQPGHGPGGHPAPPAASGASRPTPGRPAGSPQHAVAAPGGPETAGVVTLSGLLCPHGHANAPERSACRVCGLRLQGPPRPVQRPPLGSVAISTGGTVLLDRSAIIGRRPRASRVSGHDMPHLVTVPSPQQDISRSHLELRLEGWHVVAVDLGTTNGTTLHRAGAEPVRLRAREGLVLVDGDQLDLGDGVVLWLREAR